MIQQEVAHASLVILKLDPGSENGGVPRVFHFSEVDCPDPIASCWELWNGTLWQQFPGYSLTVMSNPRAKTLNSLNRLG